MSRAGQRYIRLRIPPSRVGLFTEGEGSGPQRFRGSGQLSGAVTSRFSLIIHPINRTLCNTYHEVEVSIICIQ